MAGLAQKPSAPEPETSARVGGPAIAALCALAAALVAVAVGQHLGGAAAWAVGGIAGLFAAILVLALGGGGDAKTRQLADELSEERRTASVAIAELERFRRQTEIATVAYRAGKDPLSEQAELRTGPLRTLLEATKDRASAGPVVSRIPLGEEELVGVDGEPLPEPWPAGADDPSPLDPRVRAEARRGLDELIRGLAGLARAYAPAASSSLGPPGAGETPAQLVDAVVQTAADGIEDLAAGLMRANELASVAERVTNRATLLALNAALEATRSGSEAFAAIAEETRKLAEFAREATDTISLLANEIEFKVGETITAIHATSEHAKTSLGGASAPPATPAAAAPVIEALLSRAREIQNSLRSTTAPDPVFGYDPAGGPTDPEPDSGAELPAARPEPAAEAEPAPEGSASYDINPEEPVVQNEPPPADKGTTGDFLMLEGLEPGATYRG